MVHRRVRRPIYDCRLVWRAAEAGPGCRAMWRVLGGREEYQVSLEERPGGWLRWHCTCPHAVFRAEPLGRVCKHVAEVVRRENPPLNESSPGADPATAGIG